AYRIKTDQFPRLAHLVHHRVTRIDTGRAIDALHLHPVPDIDTRGTNMHTQPAIHAIAQLLRCIFLAVAARLAPLMVVSYRDAFIIEQHALQASVRTYGRAHDLTHKSKYRVEHQCKQTDGNQPTDVLPYGFGNDLPQLPGTDHIREEEVGYHERYCQE